MSTQIEKARQWASQGRQYVLACAWEQARHAYTQAFEADPAQWWHAMEALRVARRLQPRAGAPGTALLFYPDYSASNSYQAHLYATSAAQGAEVRGLAALSLDDDTMVTGLAAARWVFHQHWLHEVYRRHGDDEAAGQQALRRHFSLLRALKGFNCTLLWTLHNLVDHDASDVQQRLSQQAVQSMVGLADQILVHDESAIVALSAQAGCDVSPKCSVLAHPLYDDLLLLPPSWPAELKDLDLLPGPVLASTLSSGTPLNPVVESGKRLAVMVGRMRPYKGGRELVAALDTLASRHAVDGLLVVMAGQLADDSLREAVVALEDRCPGLVVLVPRRLTDAELAGLVSRADLVVMPYRRVLTSGTYFLATTFGKPSLAPRSGMFNHLIDHGHDGLLYDGSVSGLAAALEEALGLSPERLVDMGARARAFGLPIKAVSDRFFREFVA